MGQVIFFAALSARRVILLSTFVCSGVATFLCNSATEFCFLLYALAAAGAALCEGLICSFLFFLARVHYLRLCAMTALENFAEPREEQLYELTKKQLFQLASQYEIEISNEDKKLKKYLIAVIRAADFVIPVSYILSEASIKLRQKELALKERNLKERQDEFSLKEEKLLLKHERVLKELEMKQMSLPVRPAFNGASQLRLVPPFQEKDVERYFCSF